MYHPLIQKVLKLFQLIKLSNLICNNNMKYYNTNNPSQKVNLKNAVMKSSNDATGLYMPESIPTLNATFLKNIHQLNLQEISFQVANAMFASDVPGDVLQRIINETLDFEIPLVNIHNNISVLELFHGPTMAFKDIGARFMAGLFGYFIEQDNHEINILAATSGDTGSAVAAAFLNKPGIKVTILYPSNRVSYLQEQQLTTMGNNITALEIDGSFDDCQALVKQAFADKNLNAIVNLASANSINFARLFPQSFYYFHAYAQLNKNNKPLVFSVPSGNYGNLTAGLIAKKMGLPIHQFIAATNANDIIPTYLQTKKFTPKPSIETISNAMDVGNPSNFGRITSLYNYSFSDIQENIKGFSFNDHETRLTMKDLYKNSNYILDPHGAIGYLALSKYLEKNEGQGIFLETAHPAKFQDVVQSVLEIEMVIPEQLRKYIKKQKHSIKMSNNFHDLRDYLTSV